MNGRKTGTDQRCQQPAIPTPRTALGKRLLEIRSKIIATGTPLLNVHQIDQEEACSCGLAAMDAMHIAAAKASKASEFITSEKSTKPIFRVTGIAVKTIRPEA